MERALTEQFLDSARIEYSSTTPRSAKSPAIVYLETGSNQRSVKKINIAHAALESSSESLIFSNITDVISDVATYIEGLIPSISSIGHVFSDIKVLGNENYAIGVTEEGFCVHVDLRDASCEEVLIEKHPLSGVVLYNNDANALIKEKKRGVVYCIEVPSLTVLKVLNIKGEGNGIGRMCFSPNEEFCFARLWNGEIICWELTDLSRYKVMLTDKNVICMNVSPDGTVVLGLTTKKIVLYTSTFEKGLENSYDFKVDAFISFSATGHLIVLAMETGIKVVCRKDLSIVSEHDMGCLSYDCIMTKDCNFIISPLETGELAFIDMNSNKSPLKIRVHHSAITSAYLTQDQKSVRTFGKDLKIGELLVPQQSSFKTMAEINFSLNTLMSTGRSQENLRDTLESERRSLEPEDSFKVLCICESFTHDIVIVGGHCNNLLVWDLKAVKKYGNLIGHQDYVHSVECINEEIVASGSADCMVKIWNFRVLTLISTLSGHLACISSLANLDHWRLASGSSDGTVKVWDWEGKSTVFTIYIGIQVLSLCLIKSQFLMIGTGQEIQCWNLISYLCMFKKICYVEVGGLRLFESDSEGEMKSYLSLGNEENSLCIENPFHSRKTQILGFDEQGIYDFIGYLKEIILFRLPVYDQAMDFFTVFPYMINSLHFYAYYDMPEYLASAILNGAPLLSSESNETPLSIAISLKHKQCIKAIIKTAWKKHKQNPFLISNLNPNSLLPLNALDISALPKLYNLLFINYSSGTKFCAQKNPLPIVKSTFAQSIPRKQLLSESFSKDPEVEIKFSRSSIPFYLDIGNEKSLAFMNSLCKCDQIQIFNTEILQRLIDYKWSQAKWYLYLESFLFFAFYIHILLESLFFTEKIPILIAMPISLLLTCVHTFYCIISFSINFWVIMDYMRFILFLVYFVLDFTKNASKEVLVACVVISSIQGVYYFKLWKGTRKLVAIIIKVGRDVFSFLLLMAYLLIALGAVLHIIASEKELYLNEMISLVTISEESSSSFMEGLFLVFMSVVNPLIMLNILLALCAESYDQSETDKIAGDYKEIADIVLRIEHLLVFKRKNNHLEYLQVCSLKKKKNVDMFKKLSKMIKNVQKEQESGKTLVLYKLNSFEKNIKSLEKILVSIKSKSPSKKKS